MRRRDWQAARPEDGLLQSSRRKTPLLCDCVCPAETVRESHTSTHTLHTRSRESERGLLCSLCVMMKGKGPMRLMRSRSRQAAAATAAGRRAAQGARPCWRNATINYYSTEAFQKRWGLPYAQEPWVLPLLSPRRMRSMPSNLAFVSAMAQDFGARCGGILLPFCVFEGQLQVRFTGIVSSSSDDGHAYTRHDISCPPLRLDGDTASVSAVYAGFEFRRLFVRQALPRVYPRRYSTHACRSHSSLPPASPLAAPPRMSSR